MITYFEEWAWGHKEPRRYISEEEARRKHAAFERYHAMVPQDDGYCVVEMLDERRVLVFFLDELNRYKGSYEFQRQNCGRMFLTHTRNWLYEGGSFEILEFFSTRTEEDGHTYGSHVTGGVRESFEIMAEPEDVLKHWDTYPEFGKYDSVCRFNR